MLSMFDLTLTICSEKGRDATSNISNLTWFQEAMKISGYPSQTDELDDILSLQALSP